MPLLVYIVLINVLVRIVASAVLKTREPKPQPLCAGCTFAHIQYAATGKIATFCTYGGVVRPMKLDDVLHRLSRPQRAGADRYCWIRPDVGGVGVDG